MPTATPHDLDRTSGDAELDDVFSALANRTRRALIARLEDGDATVSALAEPFDMTLAAVSKHLSVLERAGLVHRTRRGKAQNCSLDVDALGDAETWLAERRLHWESTLDRFAAHMESTDDSHPGKP